MRHTLGMCAIAVLLLPVAPVTFGGWTVITVRNLPEYLEVGEPVRLEFDIRQHGRELMNGRSPTVTLKKSGAGILAPKQRVGAAPADAVGRYAATITPQERGMVEITIDADWHGSDVTLAPLPVVARGEAPAPLADHDRGRQLFVAAGCVTCHAKTDDPQLGERKAIAVGPVLTGRQFPVEWLTRKVADPAALRVGTGQMNLMPALGLSEREIAAVASYVNHRAQTAAVER